MKTSFAYFLLLLACLNDIGVSRRRHFHNSNRRNDIPFPENGGESCVSVRGRAGTCLPISSCSASFRPRNPYLYRNICYWKNYKPIICCEKPRSLVTSMDEVTYSSSRNCGTAKPTHGISKRQARRFPPEPLPEFKSIVGGRESNQNQWPWMAAIFMKQNGSLGRFLCGGSLINKRFILTASHCFTSSNRTLDADKYIVILGAHKVRGDNIDGQKFDVSRIQLHEDYRQGQHYNDIALVRLSRDVPLGQKISSICLPKNNGNNDNLANKEAVVTGWGDLSFGGVSSKVLQEVKIPVIPNRQCSASYSGVAKSRFPKGIDRSLLCAGDPAGGKDACQGDSGGPLAMKKNSSWIQIGIVSFGHGCAAPGYPGIYTRVGHFRNWIRRHANV